MKWEWFVVVSVRVYRLSTAHGHRWYNLRPSTAPDTPCRDHSDKSIDLPWRRTARPSAGVDCSCSTQSTRCGTQSCLGRASRARQGRSSRSSERISCHKSCEIEIVGWSGTNVARQASLTCNNHLCSTASSFSRSTCSSALDGKCCTRDTLRANLYPPRANNSGRESSVNILRKFRTFSRILWRRWCLRGWNKKNSQNSVSKFTQLLTKEWR